jgi:hypothetical protein
MPVRAGSERNMTGKSFAFTPFQMAVKGVVSRKKSKKLK